MNRFFDRRVVITVVAFGVALLAGPSSAHHAWGDYHWATTSFPITLLAGDNVSSAWDAHLTGALADWSTSSVLNVNRTTGAAKGKCRPTAGRIEVCNGAYGQNGWLGIAQIWVTTGNHITQATTRVNDTYFNTATYNTAAWRRFVMCQEVGHDFGLDHQDENFNNPNLGTCMDYTSNPATNQQPNAHDYEMLETIYDHVDSTSTVGSAATRSAAPPAMNEIDMDGPGQWGRLVRSSRNGRIQLYELDFGRGHKVITHVFWADPDRDARQ